MGGATSDGLTFPALQLLWEGDLDLPSGRAYVSLALRNHATLKYWFGSAALVRWDNIKFDGPVVSAECLHRLLSGARRGWGERGPLNQASISIAQSCMRVTTGSSCKRRERGRAPTA